MQRERVESAAAAAIVGAAGVMSVSAGYPSVWQPLNLVVVVPAFYLVALGPVPAPAVYLLASVPIVVFFCLWSLPLFSGSPQVPSRTVVLFLVLVVAVVLWFLAGWKYGVEYQSLRYAAPLALINTVWVLLLSWLLIRARKSPSFQSSLVFHTLMFVWAAWFAFPWLGELP